MTGSRAVRPDLLVLAVAALAVTAFGSLPAGGSSVAAAQTSQTQKVAVDGGGSYTDVDAAGLSSMLANKDFPLVNVHVPYEGEIERTDLFIPFDQIESHLDQLPPDRGARIVLYCRSGSMSATAASALTRLGYSDVWNLDGGMIGWERAGYPLLQNRQ